MKRITFNIDVPDDFDAGPLVSNIEQELEDVISGTCMATGNRLADDLVCETLVYHHFEESGL